MAGSAWVKVDPVAKALLRTGLVAPGLLGNVRLKERRNPVASVAAGLVALEADLIAMGYLIGPRLRAYLADQGTHRLAAIGLGLSAALGELVGDNVQHVPLFREFPDRVPADTEYLWIQRVLALHWQQHSLPCVLCGVSGVVRPVSPCAHLVCHSCWDMDNYSGCPICHRRIDLAAPFLPIVEQAPDDRLPTRVVVLELSEAVGRDVFAAIGRLLARRTPLTPQDTEDLTALLNWAGHRDLGWLPPEIPVRETKARVLARLVGDYEVRDMVPVLLESYVDTATDLLRLLYVLQGADPGLLAPPARRSSLKRWQRRELLTRLEALSFPDLADDLFRHRQRWLNMAENLHPFEHAARYPQVAAAFAALRGTDLDERLAPIVAAVAERHPRLVAIVGNRVVYRTFASRVESALSGKDTVAAVRLLKVRPGELVRRLVVLAHRTDNPDALLAAVRETATAVSPAVIISAIGALRTAMWTPITRFFFPRGGTARPWLAPDPRPRLDPSLAAELESVLVDELLQRAAALSQVDVATIDVGLRDLVVPFGDRTASKALVRLPRGSAQTFPEAEKLRLFLHWTQPDRMRIDLDLSVALYDADYRFIGKCDYTHLRFGNGAVTHSGDLTSAPAPLGASEFVDLDLAALRHRGVRYVAMVVFSFNGVPFETMTDAFAGYLADPTQGRAFQPQKVEQRFDLTGNMQIAAPLVLDLECHLMRWLDLTLTRMPGLNNVGSNSDRLGELMSAVNTYFGDGHRVNLWQLACWHAAARAKTVQIRAADGTIRAAARRDGETVAAFATRLMSPIDLTNATQQIPADFAVLVRADADLQPKAQLCTLYLGELDPSQTQAGDFADLTATLAPH